MGILSLLIFFPFLGALVAHLVRKSERNLLNVLALFFA
jgi:hypothetical protein